MAGYCWRPRRFTPPPLGMDKGMYVVDGTASAAGANTIDKKPAGT